MSRFIPNKPDVDAADGDKDGFQIDLSKWDTETQDSVERGQRSVNKVALGAGLIALVFAGNVIAFRKSRNAPGKDAARAYHIIQKSRVFSGGRYPVLPPWLVRKYGADNGKHTCIGTEEASKRHTQTVRCSVFPSSATKRATF